MKNKTDMKHNLSRLPYRLCVGITLLNHENKVFIGKRRSKKGQEYYSNSYAWQMPQGGIDAHENPYDAALRELYEETNISSVEFLAESPEWYCYDLPPEMIGNSWKGRYRGQKQKWFALRFTGQESEIDTLHPADDKYRPEFDDWRWEDMGKLTELIIPFKKDVYKKVIDDFSYLVQ